MMLFSYRIIVMPLFTREVKYGTYTEPAPRNLYKNQAINTLTYGTRLSRSSASGGNLFIGVL